MFIKKTILWVLYNTTTGGSLEITLPIPLKIVFDLWWLYIITKNKEIKMHDWRFATIIKSLQVLDFLWWNLVNRKLYKSKNIRKSSFIVFLSAALCIYRVKLNDNAYLTWQGLAKDRFLSNNANNFEFSTIVSIYCHLLK